MSTPNPLAGMMGAAQQSLSNPMASAVPQPQGGIDQNVHPVLAAIIKALAGGAGAYGWTSMPPQQRLEAQNLEATKAETMARLAQTGAYQEGELENRKVFAGAAVQNAATKKGELERKQTWDQFRQSMQKQMEEDKVAHNKALEALGQGRIDEASRRNDAYLESVKNRYEVAEQQVGLGYGRLAVQQDLANILRYRSQLEAITTQQRGTDMGLKATQELAKMESDHWLQNLLGTGGIGRSQGAIQQAVPLPGANSPTTGAAPTPPPAPPNKIAAKRSQKAAGGAPTFHYDAQGNRVAGPAQ